MTEIPREVAYLVSFVLVEAAVIDGRSLRVPNWLTLHFALGGWAYAYWSGGAPLLGWSLAGAAVGPGVPDAAVRHRRHGGRRREAHGRGRGLDRAGLHRLGVPLDGHGRRG